MNSDKNIPRLLGAAFLIVLVAELVPLWQLSIAPVLKEPSEISNSLVSISNNLMQLRLGILLGLVGSSGGKVVLAALLFVVLHKQNKPVALVAFGWWLLEAIMVAVRHLSISALLPLSQEFVKAGAPDASYFQTLGLSFAGGWDHEYQAVLLFFSLGGMLWYYLFYKSKFVPRVLSGFGLVAASLASIGAALTILGRDLGAIMFGPTALFELSIGLWLVIKGIKSYEPES